MDKQLPGNLAENLFHTADEKIDHLPPVKGYDFNQGIDFKAILAAQATTGFQATQYARARDVVNEILNWRLSDEAVTEDDCITDPAERAATKATFFFGYTSNMVSCGVRESIRFLAQHKLISCFVTTGGGIEEDIMKCLKPTYVASWNYSGQEYRARSVQAIGNLVIGNSNYVEFETFMQRVLDIAEEEQRTTGTFYTPSRLVAKMGELIDDETSIYYWCFKNDIPVFCPGITDGAIGDSIFVRAFNKPGFVLDVAQDIVKINCMALDAKKSGCLILGGSLPKHHINNANLMRNGTDWSVYINTGQAFDGSDTGATPQEAVSWGKIKGDAEPVKVCAEAALIFPLLMAETFAAYHFAQQEKTS